MNNSQLMGDLKAIHRKSENLTKFDGQSHKFRVWARYVTDHMAMVHTAWKPILDDLATTEQDLSLNRLSGITLGPYNESAAELATKFEQFQVNWMSQHLYLTALNGASVVGMTSTALAKHASLISALCVQVV